MNAKEHARKILEGIDIEKIRDDDEKERDKLADRLMECSDLLYEETKDICEKYNRPLYSTMKQVADKAASIAARVDKGIGEGSWVRPDFYILSLYSRYCNSDGKFEFPKDASKFDKEFLKEVELNYRNSISTFNDAVSNEAKRKEVLKNFAPHICKDLSYFLDKGKGELFSELMSCYMALGQYHTLGFTLEMLRPLALRTHFIKYCIDHGGITKELIEDFESDKEGFLAKTINR